MTDNSHNLTRFASINANIKQVLAKEQVALSATRGNSNRLISQLIDGSPINFGSVYIVYANISRRLIEQLLPYCQSCSTCC